MTSGAETVDEQTTHVGGAEPPIPGIALVFGDREPKLRAVPLARGRVVIGRGDACALAIDDERLSREHAEARFDKNGWHVRDLGSRNGTFVDGVRVEPERAAEAGSVVRIGRSLLLLCADVRAWDGWTAKDVVRTGAVVGPSTRALLDVVARTAVAGDPLLVTGETGSGKELVARAYHDASGRRGPFVPVNCAAIPEGVAERVLFGARKGAFSGATDADGLVQSADGGTLFLDELGELDLAVQAKLLRVLETREVVPLGGTAARRIDLRVCAATHRDLRREVAAGRFREDLFFRIGQPSVRLLPLRQRREEIPFFVRLAIHQRDAALQPHARLVEACMLRRWPGNVRELLAELRAAALAAQAAESDVVRVEHLPPDAGMPFGGEDVDAPTPAPKALDRETIAAALQAAGGNVSAAARALGLHRTQLYRLLDRHGLV
jgi:transcriptional regulator with PAS, ATPase and Fis domain